MGAISTSSRILGMRYTWTVGWRDAGVQAIFQGVHNRLELCSGEDARFFLSKTPRRRIFPPGKTVA